MAEYIDKNVLIQELNSDINRCYSLGIDNVGVISDFIDKIDRQPIVDVREIRHGKWTDISSREVYIPDEKTTICLTEEKCSVCNAVTVFKGTKPYLADFVCPACGAEMNY